jgi:hypothetical protein
VVQTSAARVVDDFVDVLQNSTNREHHNVRQRERKRLGEEGGRRLPGGAGFERERPLVPVGSGEVFRRPGGVIMRGRRGNGEGVEGDL